MKKLGVLFCCFGMIACGHEGGVTIQGLPDARQFDLAQPKPDNRQPTADNGLPTTTKKESEFGWNEIEVIPFQQKAGADYKSLWSKTNQDLLKTATGFSMPVVQGLYETGLFDTILPYLQKSIMVSLEDLWTNIFSNRLIFQCKWCQIFKFRSALGTAQRFLTGESLGPFATGGSGANSDTAFNPSEDTYVVVWDEPTEAGASNIYAKVLREDGTFSVDRTLISNIRTREGCLFPNFATTTGLSPPTECNRHENPAVAYANGKFLIVWVSEMKAVHPTNAPVSVILGKMVDASTLAPISPQWNEGLLLSKIQFGSTLTDRIPATDNEVMSWSLHTSPSVAAFGNQETFLVVWETNKDYIGCVTPANRTSSSIYGRMIPSTFGPRGSNKNLFPIFNDSSTEETRCIPTADVTSAKKPAVDYNADNREWIVAFETAKNTNTAKPSVGGQLVKLDNTGVGSTIGDHHNFYILHSEVNQSSTNPDVVGFENGFILTNDIEQSTLVQTQFDITEEGVAQVLAEPLSVQGKAIARPRIVFSQPTPESPPEFVLSYEKRNVRDDVASTIEMTSLDTTLLPQGVRVELIGDNALMNTNQEMAAGGNHIMTTWFAGGDADEGEIFSSLVETTEEMEIPPDNQAPTAVIRFVQGGSVVTSGDTIILSAEQSSDPEDGAQLTYEWTSTGTLPVTLSTRSGPRTSFTAPTVTRATEATIRLRVFDRQRSASAPVSQTVAINPLAVQNHRPIARITLEGSVATTVPETGAASPFTRTVVTLNGLTSDDGDGGIQTLSFQWRQIDSTPANAIINPQMVGLRNERFQFTVPDVLWPDQTLTVKIELTANDGQPNNNLSQPVTMQLTIQFVNHPPVIDAGTDQTVEEGASVVLTVASMSDPDGSQIVTFQGWERIDTEPYPFSWTPDGNSIRFTLPATDQNRTLRFRATAKDELNVSSSDIMVVTVQDVNHPPTAPTLLGPADTTMIPPTRVSLTWDAATDEDVPEGDMLTYNVYFGIDNPPTTQAINCQDLAQTSCIVRDLEPNTAYFWKVEAEDSGNLSTPSSVFALSTDNSVVARWLFDEGAGELVRDSSGNAHDGTITSPDGPHWLGNGDTFLTVMLTDVVGQAMGFNGNDFINIRNLPLSGATQGAFELWLRADDIPAGDQPEVFALRRDDNLRHHVDISLSPAGQTLICEFWNANIANIPTNVRTNAIPLHQMQHYVCQFGSFGTQIFRNGNVEESSTEHLTFPTYSGYAEFGRDSRFDCCRLSGVIDEFTIYNRALSSSEITQSLAAHVP